MKEIELVIRLPEEHYNAVKNGQNEEPYGREFADAIVNGTPLPEHHGDLVDKKEVYKKFYSRCLAEVATEVLSEVTTIIPATKEEENG